MGILQVDRHTDNKGWSYRKYQQGNRTDRQSIQALQAAPASQQTFENIYH